MVAEHKRDNLAPVMVDVDAYMLWLTDLLLKSVIGRCPASASAVVYRSLCRLLIVADHKRVCEDCSWIPMQV